jgi:putative membrane protein
MRKLPTHVPRQLAWAAAGLLLAAPAYAGPDADFVEKAASGGMMEVKLGEYASKNAASEDVRSFGQRMVTDHSKANAELKELAQKHGITVPTDMSAHHQAMADELMKKKGAEFDRAYMDAMVDDHTEDVEAFRAEAKEGESEVDRWAAKTVPTLESHLELAREVDAKVGGATATGEKPGGVKGAVESLEREVKGVLDTDEP